AERRASSPSQPTPAPARPPFFLPAPPTAALYTLSLHDALPISPRQSPIGTTEPCKLRPPTHRAIVVLCRGDGCVDHPPTQNYDRSEEHTSELQSPYDLVCRLLLEKKKPLSGSEADPSAPQIH